MGKNTWRLQLAQTLLWLACFGVQALFVVDASVQQILVFENMFGFLIGQHSHAVGSFRRRSVYCISDSPYSNHIV